MSKRIVIDIGHGIDTYPPSKGVGDFAEFEFNAAVGKKAKELAEINGFEILLTQSPTGKDTPLLTRSRYINTEHSKSPILCVISLHANASDNKTAHGWGVFHWYTSTQSKRLANLWATHATKMLPNRPWGTGVWESRPNNWTNFHMLREVNPPSILVEHFFFTNSAELALARKQDFIDKSAEVAIRAVCDFAGVSYKSDKPIPVVQIPNNTKATKTTVFVKGKPVDATSLLVRGQTLVHIRPILEACGHTVDWKDNQVYVNGKTLPPATSMLLNGQTLVHIRPILEWLGHRVDWKWDSVRVDEHLADSSYYKDGNFHVIKTSADNVDIVRIDSSVEKSGNNGVNTNFFAMKNVLGVAVGRSGLFGWGVPNRQPPIPPRATLFYDGNIVGMVFTDDIRKEPFYTRIKWATSGGNLMPLNLAKEAFQSDVARKTAHTAIMVKDKEVYMVGCKNCTLYDLATYARNNEMKHAIFCDGGGSAQLLFEGLGITSTRVLPTMMKVLK